MKLCMKSHTKYIYKKKKVFKMYYNYDIFEFIKNCNFVDQI